MASPTLHVRIVEKLPSGEHKLQVTLETRETVRHHEDV